MEEDGDDKDDSKRRTRNISEKKRRDQFNFLVNELSSMVSASNRKMDKSTVLKSTISFLKNHNEITVRSRVHDVQEDWKPAFLSNVEFTYLVLEALEGFVMVFSVTGRIHYVSESITSLLGYNVGDLLNKSIFDLTFEEDRQNLFNLLQNPRIAADSMQRISPDSEIRFQCHVRRGTTNYSDESTYELIEFNGHFRTNTEQVDDKEMYQQDHESRLLFVCTGRLSTPQLIRDVSLSDSGHGEFTSRHSLEWKFLFLDHRAPPIIGYLPFEVLGTSGYDYYHFDDLEKLVSCHESLMQKGELTSCYYRFLTKGQQWIWLQSRFYITYHQWNSKPEFVVCTHRVVDYADVMTTAKEESGEVSEEPPTPMEEAAEAPAVSPSYMSDSDAFTSCQAMSQQCPSAPSGSAASTGTAGSAWRAHGRRAGDCGAHFQPASDAGSVSGSSRSSQRTAVVREPSKMEPTVVPQWSIGAQYLEPSPYVNVDAMGGVPVNGVPVGGVPVGGVPVGGVSVGGVSVGAVPVGAVPVGAVAMSVGTMSVPMAAPAVQGVLSLPTLPIIVAPDQAQIQEQLQQKHEKLQQMIVRQQEELRQVKEQLLLARLGMLQPLPNVPSTYDGNGLENTPISQAEIMYEDQAVRSGYFNYPPQPPQNPPQPPQNPPQPPPNPNMPQ